MQLITTQRQSSPLIPTRWFEKIRFFLVLPEVIEVDQVDNRFLAVRKWLRSTRIRLPIFALIKSSLLISVEPADASYSDYYGILIIISSSI